MQIRPVPALLLACAPLLSGADVQSFAGHGTATAEKATFGQAKENQKALDKAQQAALLDALKQALVKLTGARQLEATRLSSLSQDLADHSAAFLKDQSVTESRMNGLEAIVNLKVRVDLAAMKEYLEDKGVSLTQSFEQAFKVFVLTYTVEGLDPDRTKPQVLRDEVRAEGQSLDAAQHSASSQGSHAQQQGHMAQSGGMAGSSHGSASGQQSSQASGAAVSARSFSYFRVTDYADPSKRGATASNEVRSLISGAFTREGLTVATLEVPFAGQEFASEDLFVNAVLKAVRRNAEVKPADCVAIAVNSVTPTSTRVHQATSAISFHFVRVGDGVNLIPASAIAKRSEVVASDDEARTQATTMAVAAMNTRLPQDIRKGLQRLQREAGAAPAATAGIYTIEIQNLQDRSILVKVKQYLRQENFTFKSDASAGGTVETLTVNLGSRSPEEIKDVLDGLPQSLELISKDDAGAKLRVR